MREAYMGWTGRAARQLRPWLLLPMLFMALVTAAQEEETCAPPTDKKLVKRLDEARSVRNPAERHQKLKALAEENPDCAECLMLVGESAYQRAKAGAGNFTAAITYLEDLRARCPQYHSQLYFYLGNMYYAQDRYADAAKAFRQFLAFPSDEPAKMSADIDRQTGEVQRILPELAFYEEFYKDQRRLEPKLLKGVSTAADEYLPMFSPDNEILFFTRMSKYQAKGDRYPRDVEELSEARRASVKDDFDKGAPLPPPFNNGDSYGGVTVSLNNKELFVTVCKPVTAEYRNCDIYCTHYTTHMDFASGQQRFEWSPLENLGPNINTEEGWESQPSLSTDGRTLFFATLRRGSKGTDIYSSQRNDKGEWSPAKPLPAPINTDGDEKAPFMHSDSRTLYFAARPPRDENGREDPDGGHRGIGGYDIFYSRLNDDGSWTTPKNLGNPINTPQDEHGLIVSADGRTAYFASSRFRGAGGLDIYGFELPQEARPDHILIAKGEVKDENGNAVRGATVSITYMDTRKTEVLKVDSVDGRYATVVRLKQGGDVRLTVKQPGHVFDSRLISQADTALGGVAEMDMKLEKVETGKSYRVNDIRFATNSTEVEGPSKYILDELIAFLKENPKVRIEVQGHTDNVGDLESNMVLSRGRAAAVVDYLTAQGIPAGRLTSNGYGPTRPIEDNSTEKGRAANRRTTFVIISR